MVQRELLYHGETPTWIVIKDIEPTVAAGQAYWFLKKVEYIPFPPSTKEHAYIMEPRGASFTIQAENQNGEVFHIPLDKDANEPAGNLPLQRNKWSIQMDGLPSDRIEGLKLPSNLHVTYNLWFERRVSEGNLPIEDLLRRNAASKRSLFLNPTAALQKEILKDGFLPTSTEFGISAEGQAYIAQVADATASNVASRVYFARLPFNGNVRFIKL